MSATTSTTTPVVPRAGEPLISIDHERCDQCRHRAYVVTYHGRGRRPAYLSWCGHHHADNVRHGRIQPDQIVVDVRERLLAREQGDHA